MKKFVPRRVWVAEDAPDLLYQYIKDCNLEPYMVEEPVNNIAVIAPDFSNAPDETDRISMNYIRQEVSIRKGHDPLLTHELQEHLKNGGRLYMLGSPKDNVAFVSSVNQGGSRNTPAQYISLDDIEFVDINTANRNDIVKNSWTYTSVNDDRYVGVLTATTPDSSDNDKRAMLRQLSFTPEEEGKVVIIDRKEINEKYGPDYDLRRFCLSTVKDGKPDMDEAECYAQRSLEMTQIADAVRDMVITDDFAAAVADIPSDEHGLEQ